MAKEVFITKTSSYFPNEPVGNDEMELFLGMIGGKPSRVRSIILRQNAIRRRYYALDRNQHITHTNAQLAALSIKKMLTPDELEEIQVLSCGTASPDQFLPSHASMVHGEAFDHSLEIYSFSGVCLTSINALKTAYMSILSGNSQNAVCSTSELISPILFSHQFEEEYNAKALIEKNPIIAFEKDFLRFMLSDGAACCLLKDGPDGKINMRIDWIETISYANNKPTCMYMGGELNGYGELIGWKHFNEEERAYKSIWSVKQNVKLLNEHAIKLFVDAIEYAFNKHHLDPRSINYTIPHISSMFFYHKLDEEIKKRNIQLDESRWFTNLTTVGNVGSVSIFAALDELIKIKPLADGEKILLLVPESGRFSYGVVLLTVKIGE